MRMAKCHPARPHHAFDLCSLCYQRQYDKSEYNTRRRKDPSDYAPTYRVPPTKPARVPDCHPERKHCAMGMCRPCYQQARRKAGPGQATCHPERPTLARGLCHQCYASSRYWDNPEKHRKASREAQAANRKRLRRQLIEAYGGKCACRKCPESNPAFLTLEHINRDGGEHRAKVGSHSYADLRRRGFPQEGYTLLCWNCNAMTRFGRPCPHEESE